MTKTSSILLCLTFAVLMGVGQSRLAAQDEKLDYRTQGEYSGTLTDNGQDFKYGVQVIALGNGRFTGIGFLGGLPGDGWDGSTPIRDEDVPIEDEIVRFSGEHGTALVTLGAMTMNNSNGERIGRLSRVSRRSPTLGLAPRDATILFDGSSVDAWELNGKPGIIVEDELLKSGTASKQRFQDHQIHLEFLVPFKPNARGNSGVYLQGRYEVQILDSFGLVGENNECGGLYSIRKPDQNMCFPPLQWQTYDIDFHAAQFDGDKKTKNARVTVKHNGVTIHDDVELPNATTAAPNQEGPEPGFIFLQDHGNPVKYRNIWVKAIPQQKTNSTPQEPSPVTSPQIKQTAHVLKIDDSTSIDYLLALPENYESQKNWPLVLFLHGAGERGDDLGKVKVHGPPKRVEQGKTFPFIVVSPQCKTGSRWSPVELTALLDEIEKQHHVDSKRIYVTGLSMGGFGTWALAAHSPERFAAIAPICGGGNVDTVPDAIGRKIPIWVFHGAKDNVVPIQRSQSLVDAFKEKGIDVKFTIYPEAHHDSWTVTYDNPDFYEWLLSNARK